MAFAHDIKKEIYRNRAYQRRFRTQQMYGLMLFARHFSEDKMVLTTEHRAITKMYVSYVSDVIGLEGSLSVKETPRGSDTVVYTLSVDDREDRLRILRHFRHESGHINEELLTGEEDLPAFLSGVYLACGTVTDPKKDYHLEFLIYDGDLVEPLDNLLETLIGPPKRTSRRGNQVLYYKESENIEDVLTTIGATNGSLIMMETKIFKDMRNKVNRVTNCETANIDKTVNAAGVQCDNIRILYEAMGKENLPEDLRELAALRLENPDMSLRELGEALSEPISRSGVNHRLKRIGELADRYRDKTGA